MKEKNILHNQTGYFCSLIYDFILNNEKYYSDLFIKKKINYFQINASQRATLASNSKWYVT